MSSAFTFQKILTVRSPGTWLFCFWLAADETATTTPIAQTITFREPAGTIGAAVYPAVPRPGQAAQITVAGSTESARRVYAKIRPADGPPCATSYDADPGGGFIGGWSVDGPFSISANATEAYPGSYLICLWLAGASDDSLPIGGVRQQGYVVERPPQPHVTSIAILNCRTGKHLKRVRRARRSPCACATASRPRRPPVCRCRWPTYPAPRHLQGGEHDLARRSIDHDDLEGAASRARICIGAALVRGAAGRRRVGQDEVRPRDVI